MSRCVLECSTKGAQGSGCASLADFGCICSSESYRQSLEACIQASCPDLLEEAITIMESQCAGINAPTSGEVSSTSDGPSPQPSTSNPPPETINSSDPVPTPDTSFTSSYTSSPNANTDTNTNTNTDMSPSTIGDRFIPSPSTTQPTNNETSSKTRAIVGGVVGGVVMVMLVLALFFWIFRRRSKARTPGHQNTGNIANIGVNQSFLGMQITPWSKGPTTSEQTQAQNRSSQSQSVRDNLSASLIANNAAARSMFPSSTLNPPPAHQNPLTNPNGIATTKSTNRLIDPDNELSGSVRSTSGVTTVDPIANPSDTVYNNLITEYAAANRDVISAKLERKLRAARYLPTDNPSDMPAEEWGNLYGVGRFEVKRLQELYDRNKIGIRASKEIHSSGQGGPTWRPPS